MYDPIWKCPFTFSYQILVTPTSFMSPYSLFSFTLFKGPQNLNPFPQLFHTNLIRTSNLSPTTPTMARKPSLVLSLFLWVACFIVIGAYGEKNLPHMTISGGKHHVAIQRLQSFKASLTRHDSIASAPSSFSASSSPSPSPSPQPFQVIQSCTQPLV